MKLISKKLMTQRTLKSEILVDGIGLHSGASARLKLLPSPIDHGIIFVRTDLNEQVPIRALYDQVVSTQMATTLGVGKSRIGTVEHVLAALQGAGVDNVRVEVDGPEVPIMDGSALPFYEAVLKTGIEIQTEARRYFRIKKKIELQLGEKWAVVEPSAGFEVHGSIDWDHPAIGPQKFSYIEGQTSFEELAGARTFGFLQDVEALQKRGLARGGSLENAVVLDQHSVLNPGGLRYRDEFVRHKVLDALGDFKLAGAPLLASIKLHRAGHDLHHRILNEIFSNQEYFEITHLRTREPKATSRSQSLFSGTYAASY